MERQWQAAVRHERRVRVGRRADWRVAQGGDAAAAEGGGVQFYTTGKWAALYPGQEVAVVTSLGRPPLPPDGELSALPRPDLSPS